jgi:hypothetical protein
LDGRRKNLLKINDLESPWANARARHRQPPQSGLALRQDGLNLPMLQKTYEIQLLQHGNWKINTVYDDDDRAIMEARRMFGSGLYSGVRVVAEEYNQDTGATRSRTVFQDSKLEEYNARAMKERTAVFESAMADRKKRELQKQESRQEKQGKTSFLKIILILYILAVGAIGALAGIAYLRDIL